MQPVSTPAPTAAPATPTIDARISGIARGFLDDLDTNPDPDQISAESPPEEGAPPETTTEAPEQEAETPTPETAVPMVEVDVDGEKFLIPEKVKHRVMADKDYRQKTMEVAATKKQLEQLTATATQLAQQAQQMAPYHAQLFAMQDHASYLQQRLQTQELAQDPVEYNRVQGELAILLHNKDRYAHGLRQQMSMLDEEQAKIAQHQLSLEAPKLFEQFPDLQKPESREKLAKYVRDAGLPERAIQFLNYSAAGTSLAWKAHQYDVMVADQAKAKARLAEKTKTLPAATQSSRAGDSGAKDRQLHNEWQKRGGKWNDPAFGQLLRNKSRG